MKKIFQALNDIFDFGMNQIKYEINHIRNLDSNPFLEVCIIVPFLIMVSIPFIPSYLLLKGIKKIKDITVENNKEKKEIEKLKKENDIAKPNNRINFLNDLSKQIISDDDNKNKFTYEYNPDYSINIDSNYKDKDNNNLLIRKKEKTLNENLDK